MSKQEFYDTIDTMLDELEEIYETMKFVNNDATERILYQKIQHINKQIIKYIDNPVNIKWLKENKELIDRFNSDSINLQSILDRYNENDTNTIIQQKQEFYDTIDTILDEIKEINNKLKKLQRKHEVVSSINKTQRAEFIKHKKKEIEILKDEQTNLKKQLENYINTPVHIKWLKGDDDYITRIGTYISKSLINKILYDKGEFEQYEQKQLEQHLLPELTNIVQDYSSNDYCSMLSEDGDRCGVKAVYIKSIDGTEYRQDCKKYCQDHCEKSISNILRLTDIDKIEFSNESNKIILNKFKKHLEGESVDNFISQITTIDDKNKKFKTYNELFEEDENKESDDEDEDDETKICKIFFNNNNVNVKVSITFEYIQLIGDYTIKFINEKGEYIRFIKSKGWKLDPTGNSISVEYVISHKI